LNKTQEFKQTRNDNYWKGHDARIKGQKNEERFYCAFHLENFVRPNWYKQLRWGTSHENWAGIDFVVKTYTKPEQIFIQLKSSDDGIRAFWKKYSPEAFKFPLIALVVNRYHYSKIRHLLFETVERKIFLNT